MDKCTDKQRKNDEKKKEKRDRQTQRDRKAGVIDGVYTIIHLLLQDRGENEKKRP